MEEDNFLKYFSLPDEAHFVFGMVASDPDGKFPGPLAKDGSSIRVMDVELLFKKDC